MGSHRPCLDYLGVTMSANCTESGSPPWSVRCDSDVILWCLWCNPVLSFGCLWDTSGAGVGSSLRCFCGDPGMTPRASLPELASALMPGNITKFRSILFLFQGSCTGQPCLFSAPSPTPMGLRKRRFMRNPARNSVCQARATDQYQLSTPSHKKIAIFLEGGC